MLVQCMTTTRGQQYSTPPGHRLNPFSNIIFVVLIAIPVAAFVRVDQRSEVEIDPGAHVYLNGPKAVQSDSTPVIWKAMVVH